MGHLLKTNIDNNATQKVRETEEHDNRRTHDCIEKNNGSRNIMTVKYRLSHNYRLFGIHRSVHRNYIPKVLPTRCTTSQILFISATCSTCFRRYPRPSSGALNCTYRFRYLSNHNCYLLPSWMRWNCVPSHPRHQQVAVMVWQVPEAVCTV